MTDPRTDVRGLRIEGAGVEYSLRGQRGYLVGSGLDVDVRILDDDCVSRLHCTLLRESDGRLLVAASPDAKNGTYVNGQRCDRSAYLNHGDTLQVGRTVLVAFKGVVREGD